MPADSVSDAVAAALARVDTPPLRAPSREEILAQRDARRTALEVRRAEAELAARREASS